MEGKGKSTLCDTKRKLEKYSNHNAQWNSSNTNNDEQIKLVERKKTFKSYLDSSIEGAYTSYNYQTFPIENKMKY